MSTDVTIIVDNKADDGLAGEHGFSLWIETQGKRILFDTGQGPALETNVQTLGLDLSTTDELVLSHGHYDHTGGVPQVITQSSGLHIYCHPEVVRPRYTIRDGKVRSIGMPQAAREALALVPPRQVHWVQKPVRLGNTVGLTGPIPRLSGYEDTGGAFYLDPEGTKPDLIEDDMALWVETDQGLVVCLGCAHAGLINTLNYIRKLTGEKRIRAVLGGFHLLNADRERLDRTVLALRQSAPDMLIPCHCTGDAAFALLHEALGESVTPGRAGAVYQF